MALAGCHGAADPVCGVAGRGADAHGFPAYDLSAHTLVARDVSAGGGGGAGRVAVVSADVWQLRHLLHSCTGFEPVRRAWSWSFLRPDFGYVAGWGFKHGQQAVQLARQCDARYIAVEDGFIRSVFPGERHAPLSIVVDHTGMHYDADRPSDLEQAIVRSAGNSEPRRLGRARRGIDSLRRHAISKYNFAPMLGEADLGLDPSRRQGRVLVVDQTYGDASVEFGRASAGSFSAMLSAAVRENPQSEIVVKLHPEVALGHKRGYLSRTAARDVKIVAAYVNPWSLIEVVDKVYVVTSQLGMEALVAGKQVVCFGAPFYGSWGLTDDRVAAVARRRARPSVEQLFAAVYFDYARYGCAESGRRTSFEDAVARIREERLQMIGY
jgi:capsular polysaccharide export protein